MVVIPIISPKLIINLRFWFTCLELAILVLLFVVELFFDWAALLSIKGLLGKGFEFNFMDSSCSILAWEVACLHLV